MLALLLQLDWLFVGRNDLIVDVTLPPNSTSSCSATARNFRLSLEELLPASAAVLAADGATAPARLSSACR
ncbi:hypothetical protein WJX81_008519 [Elliptochloris bilobata]|uniref:Secreted protein n=1 Tax=Elliptochloris bilobata TaxID=381761 RepID=A0AAW1S796_9CHLO